jgi:hypothetical protein
VEGVGIELLIVVDSGKQVTIHEQAEEIRDGFPEHWKHRRANCLSPKVEPPYK